MRIVGCSSRVRELVEDAGLEILVWNTGQAALGTIAAAAQSLPAAPTDPHLGLQILMPNFEERMAGLALNVAQHKIELVQAIAARQA